MPARGRPRHAAAWRACGSLDAPWSATGSARPRPPLPPLPFALLHSRSRPPLARAPSSPTTWSFSPCQLRPPSSSPRPPAAPPRPSASRARAQPRSVSPARPGELTGVSRDSGDLSVLAVLPLYSTISCAFRCVSFASASRTYSGRERALYRRVAAGPRRAVPPFRHGRWRACSGSFQAAQVGSLGSP